MNYKGAYRTAPATPSLLNFPVLLLGRPIFSVKRPCRAVSVGNLPPQLPKLPSLSEKIKTVAKRRKIDMEEGGRGEGVIEEGAMEEGRRGEGIIEGAMEEGAESNVVT